MDLKTTLTNAKYLIFLWIWNWGLGFVLRLDKKWQSGSQTIHKMQERSVREGGLGGGPPPLLSVSGSGQ